MNRITLRKPDDWHLHERALVYRGGETIEWRVTQA